MSGEKFLLTIKDDDILKKLLADSKAFSFDETAR